MHDFKMSIDTFSTVVTDAMCSGSRSFFSKMKFHDFPIESNYYLIDGSLTSYLSNNKGGVSGNFYQQPVIFKNNLINDSEKDGQEITLTSEQIPYYYSGADSSFHTVYLLNINKDYYQYLQSLRTYTDDNDPFSEVSPVYSNVNGGLGIFAGFTKDSVVLRLK